MDDLAGEMRQNVGQLSVQYKYSMNPLVHNRNRDRDLPSLTHIHPVAKSWESSHYGSDQSIGEAKYYTICTQ